MSMISILSLVAFMLSHQARGGALEDLNTLGQRIDRLENTLNKHENRIEELSEKGAYCGYR